jgi:beta-glucosidase
VAPAFAFGHGLAYTAFAYSNLTVTPTEPVGPSDSHVATVTATVTNVGTTGRSGVEVAQLYLAFPPEAAEPPLQLKGFVSTPDLAPGDSAMVTFTLRARDLSFYDDAGGEGGGGWTRCSSEATFTAHVGGSSRSLPLSATFSA